MTTLADLSGIPMRFNDAGDELIFDDALTVKETKSRPRGKLRPVVLDDAAVEPVDAVQYWMYNGISFAEHVQAFADLNIQYELTLIYPQKLGVENSKTLGHIHTFPPNSDRAVNYSEVCEVLVGEAVFLMQTLDLANKTAPLVGAIHAKPGDKVVLPPNTHHLTINVGEGMLLFSDLISLNTGGNYTGLSSMSGGAYRYSDGNWTRNETYTDAAELVVQPAVEYPQVSLMRAVPLYDLIHTAPDSLRWLDDPSVFSATFPDIWSEMGELLLKTD